ncbi:hypothetical protein LB467_04195 [Salegentibacter sp. JZCK2]|uniref:hypothetical protein n=1 Tax=Salegentibacter tibetensis TaxID=2873600 RepID=UPI001CCF13CC|nr:hypothetical protein [Salegentibacter tibetensis]MBZ9728877.1 hypothetical protein [Salegentibacter tibetensis]
MRFYASLLCLLLVLASCKDKDRSEENETSFETEQSENNRTSESNSEKSDSDITYSENEEDESVGSSDKDSNKKQEHSEAITSGSIYVKMDESDANCSCYCIEFDMSNNTELCLLEDKMYINARYSKSGNNVNIYYVSPSNKNTKKDLSWQDFDTNTPIAVLNPGENDQMELDWKGFYIDGELAIDYAIYGKKTLEGTYKKQ